MKQNKTTVLRLLQRLSRNRTVVAAFHGSVRNDHLIYAEPGHPEYRRYPVDGFLVIDLEARKAD